MQHKVYRNNSHSLVISQIKTVKVIQAIMEDKFQKNLAEFVTLVRNALDIKTHHLQQVSFTTGRYAVALKQLTDVDRISN
jgi:hypothetical protein